METLRRQHDNFNISLMALIVVPEMFAFAIELMPKLPVVVGFVMMLMLAVQVIKWSHSRCNSARSIGEKLPAGKDRDAFLAYAASAKRCGRIVLVCWLVKYLINTLLLAWGESASLEVLEFLSLAPWIILAAFLLVVIGAVIKTGKHLRKLPDVDIDLPESEAENIEGKK